MDRKFAFPQHLLKCNSSSIASLRCLLTKTSTQHSSCITASTQDSLKAATFLQLISGEGALVSLALLTAASISASQSRQRSISSGSTPGLQPEEDFHAKVTQLQSYKGHNHSPDCGGSSGLCMQQAPLTAREGGTAQGIHSVTTDQNMPGTNQSQVLSSSSWKEQSLPVTVPSYPAPPRLLGWKGSHSLCRPRAATRGLSPSKAILSKHHTTKTALG